MKSGSPCRREPDYIDLVYTHNKKSHPVPTAAHDHHRHRHDVHHALGEIGVVETVVHIGCFLMRKGKDNFRTEQKKLGKSELFYAAGRKSTVISGGIDAVAGIIVGEIVVAREVGFGTHI